MNVTLFHFAPIILHYTMSQVVLTITSICANRSFFAFLVLHYCTTSNVHSLIIVLIVAHFHAFIYYQTLKCCILK